jgi:glycosyltransferase involved in cell wall biosynthesis
MFNRDPSSAIEATSWRVSLRACLVRTEVIRKMGFLRPEFETLEAAALEWGHRLLLNGVLMRHVPGLLPNGPPTTDHRPLTTVSSPSSDFRLSGFKSHPSNDSQLSTLNSQLPFSDELRFAYYRFGRQWAAWAMFRALMTHYTTLPIALRAWREVMSSPRPPDPPPLRGSEIRGQKSGVRSQRPDPQVSGFSPHPSRQSSSDLRPPTSGNSAPPVLCPLSPGQARVTVLIPTVDRYPYLRVLLDQLRQQTVRPLEIIIVDQTASERRQGRLAEDFPDLPLKILYRDAPGQCSSRNAGLQTATGDHILLLDDDVEVPPDLIQAHLENLRRHGATVSSGVAEEVGADPLLEAVRCIRASDVCPAGNTMLARSALEQSGLFDLAYEKGARADGDLGMRLYLAGELMILNGRIQVLHHHAPAGGLRRYNARRITRASSRSRLSHRNLASRTEMYLAQRYYSESQVTEALWLRAFGTFSLRGSALLKTLKCLISVFALPHTILAMRKNRASAKAMFAECPKIPTLAPRRRTSESDLMHSDSRSSLH